MSVSEFTDLYLSTLLEKIALENKTIILLCDFNVDLIKCSSDTNTSIF